MDPAADGFIASPRDDVRSAVGRAYGGEWPTEQIRVDVAAYANWPGAYTTNRPNQLTISHVSYKERLDALEIMFHEVSHATFFEQRIYSHLNAAFRRRDDKPPDVDLLAHVLQFVTPAEILRSRLPTEEREGFRSIGERVAERGRMRRLYPIVLKHWKAFLDGQIGRDEALDRICDRIDRAEARVRWPDRSATNRELH